MRCLKRLFNLLLVLFFLADVIYSVEIITPFPQKPYDSDTSRYPIIASTIDSSSGYDLRNYYVGYIDPSGEVAITPSIPMTYFGLGEQFFEGFRTIFLKSRAGWKHGYLDTFGNIAIEPRYYSTSRFSEGLAAVRNEFGGKLGFIDTMGNYAIKLPAEITKVGDFKNGRASFCEGELYGYIDTGGNKVIPARFIDVKAFSEGVAWVNDGPPCWFPEYNDEGGVARRGLPGMSSDDLFRSLIKGEIPNCRYRLIDLEGKDITDLDFAEVEPASEDLLAVNVGGVFEPFKEGPYESPNWGYIDTKGEWIITPRFWQAGSFKDGLAPVKGTKGKFGYINKNGEFVITPLFDRAEEFSEGLAAVTVENKSFYIDKQGDPVFEGKFRFCLSFVGKLGFVVLYSTAGKQEYAYINRSGEIVFSFTEDSIVPEPRDDIRQ